MSERSEAVTWVRRNLFRSPVDAVVTVIAGVVAAYVLYRLGRFVFVTGRWDVARANLTLFLVGPYDRDELWRPVVALISVAAYGGLWAGYLRRGVLAPLTATAADANVANPANPLAAVDLAAEPSVDTSIRDPRPTPAPSSAAQDLDDEGRWWARPLSLLARVWPLVLGFALLLSLATTITPWFVAAGTVGAAIVSYIAGRTLPMLLLRIICLVATFACAGYFLYVDPFNWIPASFPGRRSIGQLLTMLGMLAAAAVLSIVIGLALAKVVQRLLHSHDAHRGVVAALIVGLVGTVTFLAIDPFGFVPDLPRVGLINVWLGMIATLVIAALTVALAWVRNPAGALAGLGIFGSLVMLLVLTDAVGWDDWGGLMLNVFLAVISISLSFPLGVALALGRRSKMPLIRAICTGYIELFRGVPLYVLLVMAGVPLTLFIPRSVTPGLVARAIIVFTLFTAAYVAEIVRGGLQSLPRGQTEAGQALGLSGVRVIGLIVLPQALRNVIPAMVGQSISLFKDTTLAGGALSFLDLLASAQVATRGDEFRGQGLLGETVSFVMLLFWIGSITMSRESQRLERKLGVGTR